MPSRSALLLAAGLLLALAGRPLHAGDLKITSQNTLHYGWGDTNPKKFTNPTKVSEIWRNANGQNVVVLQEVMNKADVSKFPCAVGTCKVFNSNLYGRGWYKEQYVFFVTDPTTLKPGAVTECSSLGIACPFSRPPAALFLDPASSSGIYVLDFHAIWGKSKTGRLDEAESTKDVVAALVAAKLGAETVIGGDWNLTASEVQTQVGCTGTPCVEPTGLTSLNPSGQKSSSYDHFQWSSGLTFSSAQVFDSPSIGLPTWRSKVSDHLGVGVKLTY